MEILYQMPVLRKSKGTLIEAYKLLKDIVFVHPAQVLFALPLVLLNEKNELPVTDYQWFYNGI